MPLFSVKEVSEKLDVSEQYVRSLIRDKKIEATRVGRAWVVSEPAVQEYSANQAPADQSRTGGQLPRIKALSFFSGAMGLIWVWRRRACLFCWPVKSIKLAVKLSRKIVLTWLY